jgi:hypothetical protein
MIIENEKNPDQEPKGPISDNEPGSEGWSKDANAAFMDSELGEQLDEG